MNAINVDVKILLSYILDGKYHMRMVSLYPSFYELVFKIKRKFSFFQKRISSSIGKFNDVDVTR